MLKELKKNHGNTRFTLKETLITSSNITVAEDDVLTLGGGSQANIALNSGTIKDASGTASDAALVISGAVGTAAGSVTVTA